jgi:hypothetical protein
MQRLCEEANCLGLIIVSSNINRALELQMTSELRMLGLDRLNVYWLADGETLSSVDRKFSIKFEIDHQMMSESGGERGGGSRYDLTRLLLRSGIILDFKCSYKSLLGEASMDVWPLLLAHPRLASIGGMMVRQIPLECIRNFCLKLEAETQLSSSYLMKLTCEYYMKREDIHHNNLCVIEPKEIILKDWTSVVDYVFCDHNKLVPISKRIWVDGNFESGVAKLEKLDICIDLEGRVVTYDRCCREINWISESAIFTPKLCKLFLLPNNFQHVDLKINYIEAMVEDGGGDILGFKGLGFFRRMSEDGGFIQICMCEEEKK